MIHCFDRVFAHRCLEDISYFWSVYIQSVTVSAVASWQKKIHLGQKAVYFLQPRCLRFPTSTRPNPVCAQSKEMQA